MELSDIWLKIANNAQLTPQEKDFLARQGRETQQRNAFIAGNTTAGGQLSVPTPFYPIFSETFSTDKTSVAIDIPTGYKHLMLFGTGRHTVSSGLAAALKCVFNGDTATTYKVQNVGATGSTVSGSGGTGYFPIGFLTAADASAGEQSSFFAVINGYSSALHKSALSFVSALQGSTLPIIFQSFQWPNTAVINKLEFSSTSGNIAAGSTLSVYGVF